MASKDEFIVGLDIGTTCVRAVVGEGDEHGVQITGIGISDSAGGLRTGVVVNIESTTRAIRRAVNDAARMAGCEIGRVYVSIGGQHIQGENADGVVAVKEGIVGAEDCARVLDAARVRQLSPDREFLQMLPQRYCVDDTEGPESPVGITGIRLEAKVHIVTAARASVENLRRCVENADLCVLDMLAAPLAASKSVLDADEKEIGVALVDIGAGTADLAIWHDQAIVYTAVLPLGGNDVTRDVACCLRTSRAEAERIKCKHGCASVSQVDEDDLIKVPAVGGRKPREESRQALADIIEPRIKEILEYVGERISGSGYHEFLASGVVLTGGTANLAGLAETAEEVFGMQARIGLPNRGVGGLKDMVADPAFAVAVGLVLHGFASDNVIDLQKHRHHRSGNMWGWLSAKLKAVASIFF